MTEYPWPHSEVWVIVRWDNEQGRWAEASRPCPTREEAVEKLKLRREATPQIPMGVVKRETIYTIEEM